MPERIQLRRTKGWKKPENAVNVARPTKWGNPFRVGHEIGGLVNYGPKHIERFGREWDYEGRISAAGRRHDMWFSKDDIVETHVRWATRAEVVELFRLTLTEPTAGMMLAWPSRAGRFARFTIEEARAELAGHDLACWCKPWEPCHADILLEFANKAAV